MTKNLQMVKLFHNDFYKNKRAELIEIISPEFTYNSPISGCLNFSEYVDYLNLIGDQSTAIKSETTTDDDVVFKLQFIFRILDFVDGFDEEMTGQGIVTLKNNLIYNYSVSYAEENTNPEKFEKIKAKLFA